MPRRRREQEPEPQQPREEPWESPRAVAERIHRRERAQKHLVFEALMQMSDYGTIPRETALDIAKTGLQQIVVGKDDPNG